MAKLEFTGKLIKVGDAEQKGEKFILQEIVVEETVDYNGTSRQVPIVMQLAQKQLGHASKWTIGSEVEVKANVSGRAWTNKQGEVKYFNTIECWYLKAIGNAPSNAMANARPQENSFIPTPEGDDSLPF